MFNKIINLLIVLLLFAVLFLAIDDTFSGKGESEANIISIEKIAGGPEIRGGIFSDFIFPFELLSLLLLASLIGALYIAKKEV